VHIGRGVEARLREVVAAQRTEARDMSAPLITLNATVAEIEDR
jgi:hypothetical protein